MLDAKVKQLHRELLGEGKELMNCKARSIIAHHSKTIADQCCVKNVQSIGIMLLLGIVR